ncbi:MAG: 3'-5' exonuclease [Planctomycetes bacterium]|nr:3'-5' exonuclease [Planctomycetota bacterium]
MSSTNGGINGWRVRETPVAVIDFETTGLNPGHDRVVEVSVLRCDPGREPSLVLDTLVNPRRRMAASEIHGITDEDVADAPEFADIADSLLHALSGCVVAAYNVYFDLRFLEYELSRAGYDCACPHFCLMYLRPMLGLGRRCSLEDACRTHGIQHVDLHITSADAMAGGQLYSVCLGAMHERAVGTFGDLARLKNYKFIQSFGPRAAFRAPRLRLGRHVRLQIESVACAGADRAAQGRSATRLGRILGSAQDGPVRSGNHGRRSGVHPAQEG